MADTCLPGSRVRALTRTIFFLFLLVSFPLPTFVLTRGTPLGPLCRDATRKTPQTTPTPMGWRPPVNDRSRVRSLTRAIFFLFFFVSFPLPTFVLTRGTPFGTLCRDATRKTPHTTPTPKSKMLATGLRQVPGSIPDEGNFFFSFFTCLSPSQPCS